MTELETMMLIIRHEYEKEEHVKYNPKKFETYLLEKLAEIRISKVKQKQTAKTALFYRPCYI